MSFFERECPRDPEMHGDNQGIVRGVLTTHLGRQAHIIHVAPLI